MRYGFLLIMVLGLPAQAETVKTSIPSGVTAPDATSVRNCRRPAEAKDAQVLALDKDTLETKLAVSFGNGEFKVVTIKLWNRQDDPRPVVPVLEAARITQGKLQFYTPNLNADPDPVHDKEFLLISTLGGAQLCWATDTSMLKEPDSAPKTETTPAAPRQGLKRL
jgi:hypothetical protein